MINKKMTCAAALVLATMPFMLQSAQATSLDPSTTLVLNGVVNFAIGDIEIVEIAGNAVDGAGINSFGLLAQTDLLSVETNSLNPITGFVGATVTVSTLINNGGSILGTITGAALTSGQALTVAMFAGQTYWLNAIWTDVSADLSNFDMRIVASAVPEPGSLALLGIGLLGVGLARRRKV